MSPDVVDMASGLSTVRMGTSVIRMPKEECTCEVLYEGHTVVMDSVDHSAGKGSLPC